MRIYEQKFKYSLFGILPDLLPYVSVRLDAKHALHVPYNGIHFIICSRHGKEKEGRSGAVLVQMRYIFYFLLPPSKKEEGRIPVDNVPV